MKGKITMSGNPNWRANWLEVWGHKIAPVEFITEPDRQLLAEKESQKLAKKEVQERVDKALQPTQNI
jgi:hypothetical protein